MFQVNPVSSQHLNGSGVAVHQSGGSEVVSSSIEPEPPLQIPNERQNKYKENRKTKLFHGFLAPFFFVGFGGVAFFIYESRRNTGGLDGCT